jgi:hypothetical protein
VLFDFDKIFTLTFGIYDLSYHSKSRNNAEPKVLRYLANILTIEDASPLQQYAALYKDK